MSVDSPSLSKVERTSDDSAHDQLCQTKWSSLQNDSDYDNTPRGEDGTATS